LFSKWPPALALVGPTLGEFVDLDVRGQRTQQRGVTGQHRHPPVSSGPRRMARSQTVRLAGFGQHRRHLVGLIAGEINDNRDRQINTM
jgi:hypothetical protein